jgi:hypothetical protein
MTITIVETQQVLLHFEIFKVSFFDDPKKQGFENQKT